MRDMLRFAAEFGMTPSARARIEGKGNAEAVDPIRKKYFKR
jgi:phage terminase small subunit